MPARSASEPSDNGARVLSPRLASTSPTIPPVAYTAATSAAEPDAPNNADTSPTDPASLSLEQLRHLWDTGASLVLLDVRTERSYEPSPTQARGAIRMPPDHVDERASELNLPREAWIVCYCA